MAMKKLLLTSVAALFLATGTVLTTVPASAADIHAVLNCYPGFNCITLQGEIKSIHDYGAFARAADSLPRNYPTSVYLNSPGGNVRIGMAIIAEITMRGYDTVVPANATCASMCANIWLAGKRRFVTEHSRVGFHSTSIRGVRSEHGNEEVKEFYRILNLIRRRSGADITEEMTADDIIAMDTDITEETMNTLVAADPDGMLWMTAKLARKLGIEYGFIPIK